MISDTQELLARFVNNGSESAFHELVTRYFDLVHSTAVRLLDGDTHRAEDVAQMVFSDLARMASKLASNTMLGGWLHRHTCFVARTAMRGERRRQAREKQAVEMNALNQQGESVLSHVAPILGEAINELGADDRDAILLRFFERRHLRAVGEALGMSENAAQKRVTRAVQELGTLLQRRGVTLSSGALASGLAAGAVKAAPAGLALAVAGAVLAGVSTTGGFAAASAKVAALAKLKLGIAAAFVVVVSVITGILLLRQPTAKAITGNRLTNRELSQKQSGDLAVADVANPKTAVSGAANEVLNQSGHGAEPLQGGDDVLTRSKVPSVAVPQPVMPRGAIGTTVRLVSKIGSKVRIEGTSNIHDWQVEGSIIGGVLETGPGIPLEPGTPIQPGPVWATAEAFIKVRSLMSIEKDGRSYSDGMNEVMYESLQATFFPTICYRLLEMSFKGTTNFDHTIQYEYQSRGELSIAGVTNQIYMPIFLLPLGGDRLKISGRTTIKMTSFQIEPPAPKIALGMIKTGDEVVITVSWMLGLRNASESSVAPAESQTPLHQQPTPPTFTPIGHEEMIPAASIQFNTQLAQVLAIYAELAQAQLDIDDAVKPALIRFTNREPVTRAQAIALLDNALLEQAGIVVTHPESNRVIMSLRR
ncbi:MAG TPA: sigma-70 family RNA polymerase sigma factor [Candidatus Limnocylindrales bacterium]|nr:sigma-70 family RNA polymerase sigma factor [Candidatus Limnocylindrales bacterium]